MKTLRLRLVLLVIALLLFLFGVAFQDAPDFNSLEEFLMWVLEGGGAMLLAGFVVAYFLENLTFFHNLPLFVKKFTPWVLAALLSLGAKAVLLGDLLSYVPAIVQTVILTFIAWLFSQIAYKGLKEGGYADSTKALAAAKIPPTPQG